MARALSVQEKFQRDRAQLAKRRTKIRKALDKYVNTRRKPGLIYHFTSARAAQAILKSGTLRLTDLYRQNDPSEMRHCVDAGLDKMVAMVANTTILQGNTKIAQMARRDIKLHLEKTAHKFIACFSKTKDEIGQWREYADRCRGYALVFDRRELERAFREARPTKAMHGSFTVLYDDPRRDRLQSKLCRAAQGFVQKYQCGRRPQPGDVRRFIDVLFDVCTDIVAHAPVFKHTAYKAEEEYRFFCAHRADDPPTPKNWFRKKGRRIKFVELDWGTVAPRALVKVIVGPAADSAVARALMVQALHRYSHSIPIEYSDIPCRP